MRHTDSGAGRIKTLFSLFVLVSIIYIGVKVLPPYVTNYELKDFLREESLNAVSGGQRLTVDLVKKHVLREAQDLDLPVKPEDVKVVITGRRISIDVHYTVPVDLVVFTLPLEFNPTAENKAIF